MAELSNLLTIAEVAAHLRVSPRKIYRIVELKKLRAIKIEGQYRISQEDLAQYIALNATMADQKLFTVSGAL